MLYHVDVGFPKNYKLKSEVKVKVNYSYHAKHQAREKYGINQLPEIVTIEKSRIFEIETDNNNKPIKVCFRIKYNNEYDLCYAMLLHGAIVKTVWMNKTSDKHSTLDVSKYDKP